MRVKVLLSAIGLTIWSASPQAKQLLWGDTHLHTSYSFDAYTNGNRSADPATAYRYAMGEPVIHPFHRARVQIETPLDFLVVSDHAEFMGVIKHLYESGSDGEDLSFRGWLGAEITAWLLRRSVKNDTSLQFFGALLPEHGDAGEIAAGMAGEGYDNGSLMPDMPRVRVSAWEDIGQIADRYNKPGEFTALIGWEWSGTPGGANLHRIVVSDANAAQAAKIFPFAFTDSPFPEDLWAFLEEAEGITEARFVAIPHNSNLSKGWMFDTKSLRGKPIDENYATTRARWEPIAEITQIKGDSETHPDLSPNDPYADYELYPYYLAKGSTEPYVASAGDYLRSALKRGLEIENEIGVNPYRLGFIGSTDSHSGLSSAEEDNFHGKMALDSIPERKAARWAGGDGPNGWTMSASGLAAVWASENTREAILDAIKRRDVYATTGPRIALQTYLVDSVEGISLDSVDATEKLDLSTPMGSQTSADRDSVHLVILAAQDPLGASLERVHVVKGWLDAEGQSHEKLFTVASSQGQSAFNLVWTDPEFDPSVNAFYYVRVIQVPTARHSELDARALEIEDTGYPKLIQERAYSSPIWLSAEPQ